MEEIKFLHKEEHDFENCGFSNLKTFSALSDI